MTTTANPVRVALVDDHFCARDAYGRLVLGLPGYTLAFAAENGRHYVELCKQHGAPHLALVDLHMPGMDGWQLLAWMREHQPRTKALVLTSDPSDDAARRAWVAGACAVLDKAGHPDEVHQALDHVRLSGFHHNALVRHRLTARPVAAAAAKGNPLHHLSPRQQTILRRMMEPDKLTVQDIATQLDIEPDTVAHHRKAIFRKLKVHSAHAAVALARDLGFR